MSADAVFFPGRLWARRVLAVVLGVALAMLSPAAAASSYRLQTVVAAPGVVWSFAFLSPQELLLTLRQGRLLYVDLANNTKQEIPLALDIVATGQGGLLDVQVWRRAGADFVYLTYSTRRRGQLTTALARGVWHGDSLSAVDEIFVADTDGGGGRHFGSRLKFEGGHVYMTIGDRGERDLAQDLSSHNGKILRLTPDGKPAANNPFADVAGALPEIWSYGHRNPQGIDTANGALYSVEYGPRGGDELNRIERGKNYGWPLITYGREYWGPKIGDTHRPGMEQPIVHWTPSISPSGMAFYRGDKITEWKNNLFVASLGATHLRRLVLKNGEVAEQEALFGELKKRIRHVRSAPDGYLYFSTDNGDIIKVSK